MRRLTLAATAAMFIGAQAALAAPLPSTSGQQLRGDDSPIISVKHKKKHKMKGDMSSGGGTGAGTAGGGMSSGSMPSGANMGSGGGAPTGGGGGK
jgi:hypothetical protein